MAIINLSANPLKDFGIVTNVPFRYKSGDVEADVAHEKYYDTHAVLQSDSLQKSLPSIRISARLQKELLSSINVDLLNFENDTKNKLKPASKEVPGIKVNLKTAIRSEMVSVRNVLGIIEGENKNKYVVVGAHYDHIGKYGGYIYNGADDKCGFSYTKAYKGFEEMSQKNIKDFGLDLVVKYNPSERPTGGSDYAPIAAKDIPVIAFMAAMHPDYHKPSDEIDKIQWGKMENIIKLGFLNVYILANSDLKTLRKD